MEHLLSGSSSTDKVLDTDARQQITSRTKAVVVYHVAGYPADTAALRALCDEHSLILIEDANAAYGAR